MPHFSRYVHITQKCTLTFIALYLTLGALGQSWTWIDKEPLIGQLSLLRVSSADNAQLVVHGFQNKVVLNAGDIFEPKGEQDLVFSLIDKTGNLQWHTAMYNKGFASISNIHWLPERNEWLITGVYWDTMFIDNQKFFLPEVNKALFLLCLDGSDGSLRWVSPVGGEGSRWAGGVCATPSRYFFTGSFTGRLDWGALPPLETSICGAFLLELDQHGIPVSSFKFGEGDDLRLSTCVLTDNEILHGGNFRGLVHFQSWSDAGRIQDQELLFVHTDLSGQVNWLRTGKGVGDDILTDLHADGSGRWIAGGSFAGNLQFNTEFNLRSLGSLPDGFLLLLDSLGMPVDARVYSNSGSFQAQQISRFETFWALNGTFDGSLFLPSGNLISPVQSRSGVSLLWDPDKALDTSIFYPVNDGLMSYICLSGEETVRLYANFKGQLNFDGKSWMSDAYHTWRWGYAPLNLDNLAETSKTPFVYPNPFEAELYLNDEVLELELYRWDGTLVVRHTKVSMLNLFHLMPGIYLARLRSKRGWQLQLIRKM